MERREATHVGLILPTMDSARSRWERYSRRRSSRSLALRAAGISRSRALRNDCRGRGASQAEGSAVASELFHLLRTCKSLQPFRLRNASPPPKRGRSSHRASSPAIPSWRTSSCLPRIRQATDACSSYPAVGGDARRVETGAAGLERERRSTGAQRRPVLGRGFSAGRTIRRGGAGVDRGPAQFDSSQSLNGSS